MPNWPVGLPQLPLGGDFTEKPPNLTLRSQTDIGPAKVRKRYTAGPRQITPVFRLTSAEVAVFDDFYLNQINGGADQFTWVNPRTNASAQLRIFSDTVEYKHVGADVWDVAMTMEILP